jgi:hypothetical protein
MDNLRVVVCHLDQPFASPSLTFRPREFGSALLSLSADLAFFLCHRSTSVSSATRDEVLKLKSVTGRMQQLAARSRAFGEGLRKEMDA